VHSRVAEVRGEALCSAAVDIAKRHESRLGHQASRDAGMGRTHAPATEYAQLDRRDPHGRGCAQVTIASCAR